MGETGFKDTGIRPVHLPTGSYEDYYNLQA